MCRVISRSTRHTGDTRSRMMRRARPSMSMFSFELFCNLIDVILAMIYLYSYNPF